MLTFIEDKQDSYNRAPNILSGQMKSVELEFMNSRQLVYPNHSQSHVCMLQSSYGQQIGIKDDQIRALQEQVNIGWMKYEALAKPYSQLRMEHLNNRESDTTSFSCLKSIPKPELEVTKDANG
jgi:hypothetical protein